MQTAMNIWWRSQQKASLCVFMSKPQTTSKTGWAYTCRCRSACAWQFSQREQQTCRAANSELQHHNNEHMGALNSLRWLQASKSDYLHIHHRGVTGVWVVCSHFQLGQYYCQGSYIFTFLFLCCTVSITVSACEGSSTVIGHIVLYILCVNDSNSFRGALRDIPLVGGRLWYDVL